MKKRTTFANRDENKQNTYLFENTIFSSSKKGKETQINQGGLKLEKVQGQLFK